MSEHLGLDNGRNPGRMGSRKNGSRKGLLAQTLQAKGMQIVNTRDIVYQLTLHLCRTPWRFSPRLGGSAWQRLSPVPRLAVKGQGLSPPQALWREKDLPPSPSVHKVQCGAEALEIGSECGWGRQKWQLHYSWCWEGDRQKTKRNRLNRQLILISTQFIQHLSLNMYRCCDANNDSNFQSSHEE